MQALLNKIRFYAVLILVSCCLSTAVNSQTPADDPGIGGPGIGAAPAGDGSPIVPFDGEMSLMFAVSGIAFATFKLKNSNNTFLMN